MNDEMEWAKIRGIKVSRDEEKIWTAPRMALAFGVFTVAATLIATPLLDRSTGGNQFASQSPFGIDPITTASTPRTSAPRTYTVRRSVLQSSPTAECIISASGQKFGDC